MIDPVRHRTAAHADWYIPIRPGTDGALALALMNVIIGEGLADEAYVRDYTVGYDELIRIGVAIERHAGGGQTVRSIACLPALTGAWRRVGGGLLQLPLWAFPVNWPALLHPELATPGTRVVNRGQRAFPDRHCPLRRPGAAGRHAARAARHHVQLGPLVRHAEHPGHRAGRRGYLQHRAVPAPGRPDGVPGARTPKATPPSKRSTRSCSPTWAMPRHSPTPGSRSNPPKAATASRRQHLTWQTAGPLGAALSWRRVENRPSGP